METEKKKLAVTAIIYNDGKILSVSRKDNVNDFGLPGGKVDKGETAYQALVREVFEETGISIISAMPCFFREDSDYMVLTFYVTDYTGEINTTESGIVVWGNFELLKSGSFGDYNAELESNLLKMIL